MASVRHCFLMLQYAKLLLMLNYWNLWLANTEGGLIKELQFILLAS